MSLFDRQSLMRALSPKYLIKAFQHLDKSMATIVMAAWGVACASVLIALYALWLVSSAKSEIAAAEIMEPEMPRVTQSNASREELKPVLDRMNQQFNDLNITLGNDQSLTISAVDGGKYKSWLTALSYIDTISPQYKWTIKDLCVGTLCPARETLMSAKLVAEKISFTAPVR